MNRYRLRAEPVEDPLPFAGRKRPPSWEDSPMKGRAAREAREQAFADRVRITADTSQATEALGEVSERARLLMREFADAFDRVQRTLDQATPETIERMRAEAAAMSRGAALGRPGPIVISGKLRR